MSKTKHLNRSCKQVLLSDMSSMIVYHKGQGIDAPFKKSEAAFCGFSFILAMQKDLSEWINISKIEIDDKTVKKINKPFTEE